MILIRSGEVIEFCGKLVENLSDNKEVKNNCTEGQNRSAKVLSNVRINVNDIISHQGEDWIVFDVANYCKKSIADLKLYKEEQQQLKQVGCGIVYPDLCPVDESNCL